MSNDQESTGLPLNESIDLSGAEVGFPVFPNGTLAPARILKIELRQAKANPNNQNIAVVFETTSILSTLDGIDRAPGVPFTTYIPNGPSMKNPDWDWQKNKKDRLAEIKLAVTGDKTGQFNSADYIGKEVILRLGLSQNQSGDASNDIKRVMALGH